MLDTSDICSTCGYIMDLIMEEDLDQLVLGVILKYQWINFVKIENNTQNKKIDIIMEMVH